MELQPCRNYRKPHYPTKLQFKHNPSLYKSSIPKEWLLKNKTASALAIAISFSSCSDKIATSVGCVTVLPPTYLTEEEAISIISEELKKDSINLSTDSNSIHSLHYPFIIDAVDTANKIAIEFVSKDDIDSLSGMYNTSSAYAIADSLTAKAMNVENDFIFKAFHDPEYEEEEYSKEMLREQIQSFIEWLKSQGLI